MDKKIELDSLSEEMFNELLSKVHTDIIEIVKESKNRINELLNRLDLECSIAINYKSISDINAAPVPTEVQVKKKRGRKPKVISS